MTEKYTSEFKAKVALEAVTDGPSAYEAIADKYGVSVDEVKEWASKLQSDATKVFGENEPENVTISTHNESFIESVEFGVTKDDLNYHKLIFWSSFTIGIIIIFAVSLVYFAQFSLWDAQKETSYNSPNAEVHTLHAQQQHELNTFGVVDIENGIYRIPIDSAISKIAID